MAARLQKKTKAANCDVAIIFFSDVGIVNFLAKRERLEQGSELFGKAFENWCFHELYTYNAYKELYIDLSYWRLAGGTEVDFIINDMEIAIEAKAAAKISSKHLKGLRSLKQDHHNVKRRILICCDNTARTTEDGTLIEGEDVLLIKKKGKYQIQEKRQGQK